MDLHLRGVYLKWVTFLQKWNTCSNMYNIIKKGPNLSKNKSIGFFKNILNFVEKEESPKLKTPGSHSGGFGKRHCFFKPKKEDFIVILSLPLSLNSPFTAEESHRGASVKVRSVASHRVLPRLSVSLCPLGFIFWLGLIFVLNLFWTPELNLVLPCFISRMLISFGSFFTLGEFGMLLIVCFCLADSVSVAA